MKLKSPLKTFVIPFIIFLSTFVYFASLKPKTVNEHLGEPNVFPKNFSSARHVLSAVSDKSPLSKNPQFVLLSFDGSRNLQMWEDTREFADEMNAKGKGLHFTYFISGVYFLPKSKANLYHPPSFSPGTSLIGFADISDEIPMRVAEVKQALSEGHEIASHLNGHFQGGSLWNKADWLSEIFQFRSLLKDSGKNSGHLDVNFPDTKNIVGIRTPNLSKNKSLYSALEESGFVYDSSQVGEIDDPPYKIGSIWEIPLKNIPLDGTRQTIISMDYNFWSRQSDAKNTAKKGSNFYHKYYDQTLDSYLNYFNHVYHGSRAPVVIGHHFSLWNDGVYWQAMKDFAEQVCGLPDVRCATFSEYVKYLNSRMTTFIEKGKLKG